MITTLDALFAALSKNPFAKRFTIVNRLLLAGGFIPTGLVKMLGQPFTSMPETTTVGRFFAVFFENQLWYQSVGWAQFIAGFLLLFPRTAHFGAFMFLPIIININLITIGVGFKGTPVITGLMLLSNLWLVAWEYPRWRNWFDQSQPFLTFKDAFSTREIMGVGIGSVGFFIILAYTRGFLGFIPTIIPMALLAIGFFWWLIGFVAAMRRN